MKPLRMSVGQIYAVGGAACALVTIGAWFCLVGPALASNRQQRELQSQTLERHRELPKLTVQLTLVTRESSAIGQAIEQTHVTLQPPSALNERLADLERTAADCGITLDEVRPGELVAGNHFQTIPMHLTASADYASGTRFIHRLHESFPDVGVRSMQMDSAGTTGKASTGGASLHLDLIWFTKR